MITIYTIAYNESVMLPYFIYHYKRMFNGFCKIVIFDNQSTDATKQIALDAGCEVIEVDTSGKLSDRMYLDKKNNCWKDSLTDWVIVCDVDELLEFTASDLLKEDEAGATVIRSQGFNMVNMTDNLDVSSIKTGVRAPSYDKLYCFNTLKITDINYLPGCHAAGPRGDVQFSIYSYRCYHYKYLNLDYMIKRHAHFASRMSEENKNKGWAVHYHYPESRIRAEFEDAIRNAKQIIF